MNIIEINNVEASGADIFSALTEAQLRHNREVESGLFIAESPQVIRVAPDAGYEPYALLCERRHISLRKVAFCTLKGAFSHPDMPPFRMS